MFLAYKSEKQQGSCDLYIFAMYILLLKSTTREFQYCELIFVSQGQILPVSQDPEPSVTVFKPCVLST